MATAAGVNPATVVCVMGGMELSDRAEKQTKFAVSSEEEEKWLTGGGRITLLC